jgi:hypothetical protein
MLLVLWFLFKVHPFVLFFFLVILSLFGSLSLTSNDIFSWECRFLYSYERYFDSQWIFFWLVLVFFIMSIGIFLILMRVIRFFLWLIPNMWVLKASKPACVMVTIVEYTPYFWFFSAVFFSFLFFLIANLLTLDNLSSKLSFNFYEIATTEKFSL